MTTTNIEKLTFQQVAILANSGEMYASEFGQRAIRFLTLVAKGGDADINDLRNLGEVLGKCLNDPVTVAYLNEVLAKARVGCPLIDAVTTWKEQINK